MNLAKIETPEIHDRRGKIHNVLEQQKTAMNIELLVFLSEKLNLTFDGAKGSILNEETRIVNDEGIGSVNVAYGRSNTRSIVKQRNKSKGKGNSDITCYRCDRKGHKQLH